MRYFCLAIGDFTVLNLSFLLQMFYWKEKFQLLIGFQKSLLSEVCNFIKKETLAQMFSSEICDISKDTFFTEHLWTTSSGR